MMDLPADVTVVEMLPRDGFQRLEEFVPTDEKVEIIDALSETGVDEIEITSFTHPKAVPTLRDREVTMAELMADAAPHDANAREWTEGFPRTFRAADRIVADDGPVTDRAARAFLDLLAEAPDTLVATEHGEGVAQEVSARAAEIDDLEAAREWATELVDRGINPGTTADLTAAALYVALVRGVSP